jgi:hypothetical protein
VTTDAGCLVVGIICFCRKGATHLFSMFTETVSVVFEILCDGKIQKRNNAKPEVHSLIIPTSVMMQQ